VADDAPATVAVDQLDALVVVLDLVRTGAACTRPDMARRSGFGRTVVTQRVQQLLDSGLLEEGALAPSTGGRAPRELRFCADAGHLLVAEVGATSVEVAVTDLNGALLHRQHGDGDVTHGPDYGLGQVEAVFDAALTARPAGAPPIWGIGVSVPGPVEFATGQPVAPPIMPGWDRYPIRKRLAQRFGVPVWVDTDVNLMALGELRSGLARGEQDVLYIKIGTGIGAGLVSGGRLHRAARAMSGTWPCSTTPPSSAAAGTSAAWRLSPEGARWPARPPPPLARDAAASWQSWPARGGRSTRATSPPRPSTATRSVWSC
jgi:hypothetical protein